MSAVPGSDTRDAQSPGYSTRAVGPEQRLYLGGLVHEHEIRLDRTECSAATP